MDQYDVTQTSFGPEHQASPCLSPHVPRFIKSGAAAATVSGMLAGVSVSVSVIVWSKLSALL